MSRFKAADKNLLRKAIQVLDDSNPNWTVETESLIDGIIFISDEVSHEMGNIIPSDAEDCLEAVDVIIKRYFHVASEHYSSNSSQDIQDTANEVMELRAQLSVHLYLISNTYFKEMAAKKITIGRRREAAEGKAYKKAFETAIVDGIWNGTEFKKLSQSLADSYARKVFKNDPEYLEEIEDCDRIESNYWAMNRIFEQANEVKTSMSKMREA